MVGHIDCGWHDVVVSTGGRCLRHCQGGSVEVPLSHFPLEGGDDLDGCVEDSQLSLRLVILLLSSLLDLGVLELEASADPAELAQCLIYVLDPDSLPGIV